jgi:signal transduction histidine kinase
MDSEVDRSYSECVGLIAPTARDAEVTRRLLESAGVQCAVLEHVRALDASVREGLGALLVTELSLADGGGPQLARALEHQPPWSDLPVLALCREGQQAPALTALLQDMRNVTVLDRPASTRVVVSALKAALRGRRWQYQIRDQLHELMQADRALRQADQRKDEFLATLAHELRNPLAPLKTGLHVLRVSSDRDQHARVSAMMERQLTHLVKLIDELLEVSRIATGKVVLQRERVDMREVLAQAVESSQPLLDAARHQLTLQRPDKPLRVDGDATRLTQSVGNLINNAIKYTPNGGRIEVALAERGSEAVVTVKDNGLGIPPDMLGRVFDLFTQVNRTLERSQGGLGIGLSLVRSLVALHGGRVSAASSGIGQGSTFTLRLPLASDAAVSAPDELHGPCAAAHAPRRLRVQVVDDNMDAAQMLGALLTLDGHDVRVDYSGAAALRTAVAFLPEVVFCDLGMPGMGGYEFASRLRHDARFAATRLVAVTGWGADEDRRRSRGAGFDAHLTKPASSESIAGVLATL